MCTGSLTFKVESLRSETLILGSPAKVLLRSESLAPKDLRSRKVMLRSPESRPAEVMLWPQGFLEGLSFLQKTFKVSRRPSKVQESHTG